MRILKQYGIIPVFVILSTILIGCHKKEELNILFQHQLLLQLTSEEKTVNEIDGGSPTDLGSSMVEIQVPENFDFKTLTHDDISIALNKKDMLGYPGIPVQILDKKGIVIFEGTGDSAGRLSLAVNRFIDNSLYVQAQGPGTKSGKIPLQKEELETVNRQFRSQMNEFDLRGTPTDLAEVEVFSSTFLKDLNAAFPESLPLYETHPEYLLKDLDRSVLLKEDAEVWISFIHEGAGYRNSFYYFVYDEGNEPTSKNDIDPIVVFPNASFLGSGGGLRSGDTVYLGEHSAGKRLGFSIGANSWNGVRVDQKKPHYYSLSHLNPESTEENRIHVAALWHEKEQRLVLGFEDLNRDLKSDHDFNDVLFTVRTNPPGAVDSRFIRKVSLNVDRDGDGISDNNDAFPDDSQRAFRRYFPARDSFALIAFEDLFPGKGDYDFNDLVVAVQIIEILDAETNVKEFTATFEIKALGAAQHNAFSLQIDTAPDNLSHLSGQIGGLPVGRDILEAGHTKEIVLKVFEDTKKYIDIPSGFKYANTEASSPLVKSEPMVIRAVFREPLKGIQAPFNPFIHPVGKRGREIHLLNHRPTELADFSYFGMQDDRSNPDQAEYYRDSQGFPWAMILSPDWRPPLEKKEISRAYPKFKGWIESSGRSATDWMKNPNLNYIRKFITGAEI